MANKRICPSCFHDIGEYDVCPKCGFALEQDKRELYHLPIGTVLEKRYIIGLVVGFGGFGVIYKAWDTDLGIPVAIKEFYPAGLVTRQPGACDVIVFSHDGDREDQYRKLYNRFLDEARNMAKFHDHPDIVDVFSFFPAHNTAYIVMEFLDGLPLSKYLAKVGGKLSYEDAVTVLDPVMRAIEAIHGKRILHRDISPDNIFLTVDNRVKVIDFGAARLSRGEDESTLTAVLKPGYAPPEQYQAKGRQGPYTDVYALGATAYRILTGKKPEESVDRAQGEELKRPSELGVEMPLNAEKAIMKAMALKPGLRFQHVSEMRQAFNDKKTIDFPEIELKKRRRRRAISAVSVLAAIAAVILGGVYYYMNFTIEASKLDDDSIVVWVPTVGESLTTDLDDATLGFTSIEDNRRFQVELVGVPEEEYSDRLSEAVGTDEFPDVFRGDLVDDGFRAENAADVRLYYSFFDMEDYRLLGDHADELRDKRVIPVGISLPVAYVNLGLLAKIGQEPPESFGTAESLQYDITRLIERDTAHFCLTANPEELPYIRASLGADGSQLAADDWSGTTYTSDYEVFASRDAVIYLGSTSELIKIQNTESLRSTYTVVPLEGERIYAQWGNEYSISAQSTSNRQKLAMLYLSYLSGVGVNSQIPIERSAFDDYIKSNTGFLGFLAQTDETGVLYADRLVIEDPAAGQDGQDAPAEGEDAADGSTTPEGEDAADENAAPEDGAGSDGSAASEAGGDEG